MGFSQSSSGSVIRNAVKLQVLWHILLRQTSYHQASEFRCSGWQWINSAGNHLLTKQETWHVSVSIGPTLDLHLGLTEPAAWGIAQLCLCDCVSNPDSPGAASDIPITANSAWTPTPVPWKLWWCNQTHFCSDCEKTVGAADQDPKILLFHYCLFYSCFLVWFS